MTKKLRRRYPGRPRLLDEDPEYRFRYLKQTTTEAKNIPPIKVWAYEGNHYYQGWRATIQNREGHPPTVYFRPLWEEVPEPVETVQVINGMPPSLGGEAKASKKRKRVSASTNSSESVLEAATEAVPLESAPETP